MCHGVGADPFCEERNLQQGTAPRRRKALSQKRKKAADTAGMQQLAQGPRGMLGECSGPKVQARKEAYSILLDVQRSSLPQGHTFDKVCSRQAPLHWC